MYQQRTGQDTRTTGANCAGDTQDWSCWVSTVQVIQRIGAVGYQQCKWYKGLELLYQQWVIQITGTFGYQQWVIQITGTTAWISTVQGDTVQIT